MGILCAIVWILAALVVMTWLAGCASSPTPVNSTFHPLQSTAATVAQLHNTLSGWNVFALVVLGASMGLAVYGVVTADTLVERVALIVGAVAAGIVIITFVGIIALPFAPWVIGGVGVLGAAAVAYYVKTHYFNVPAASGGQAISANPR
jgi:uncharacterized protein YceK